MSAVFYQDPVAIAALQMERIAPGTAATNGMASSMGEAANPVVMTAYATDTAIRGVSTSPAMDAGMILVMGAIAIPNLLRSRVAANEANAVGSLRVINVSQITYRSTYPDRGFAPDLATLGPPPNGAKEDADHAGYIEPTLGCNSGEWCEKSGYRFRVTAVCLQGQCAQYVAVATPVNASTGQRSFCSTSDGVIHARVGPPLTAPLRVMECKTWGRLE
jgi:type II secretory pathway pseudopilin PulG